MYRGVPHEVAARRARMENEASRCAAPEGRGEAADNCAFREKIPDSAGFRSAGQKTTHEVVV